MQSCVVVSVSKVEIATVRLFRCSFEFSLDNTVTANEPVRLYFGAVVTRTNFKLDLSR